MRTALAPTISTALLSMALAVAGATGAAAQAGATLTEDEKTAPANDSSGGNDAAALAKQLANPVAALISVPFQFNYDQGFNSAHTGQRLLLNIQPVIPISLTPDWNLISRTILPLTWSDDLVGGSGRVFGTGDITQSLFLSPAKPWNGIILGVGPVALIPSGSSDLYTAHQWGGGPTAVALVQMGPWTYGALVNHIWSFASTGTPATNVSSTFLQPFLAYTTPDAWTFTLNTESTYNWNRGAWTVPINAIVSKVVKIGPQLVSFSLGARYYAASPEASARTWGARAVVTLLFPK
jgi:hypothetical protein